jgi:hypothetical protein
MEVLRKGFGSILHDNDSRYLTLLERFINDVDPYAGMEITKTNTELKFRVCLSAPAKFEQVLHKLNNLHNKIGIHTDFGKSMKKSAVIYYTLQQI